MNEWERFAREDALFYIATDLDRAPDIEEFFDTGVAISRELDNEVAADLPGRRLAIEIGAGVGRLLFPVSRSFDVARGVDLSPTMLEKLRSYAETRGISNVQTFAALDRWDEPPGSADYVYSYLVFQHIESALTIGQYLQRTVTVLRPGGIAQFQFDTRAASRAYRLRHLVPDALLPRTQRRGIRRIRRDAEWVREAVKKAGLTVLRERGQGSAEHWFTLRR